MPVATLHERFRLRTLDDLHGAVEALGLDLPVSPNFGVLSSPVEVAGQRVPNRFVALPMEGFDAEPDGSPGVLSFRRYLRYARGGFGMIWVEATAILPEARSNPRQLWIASVSVPGFSRLVEAIRKAAREAFGWEIVIVVQLTHSGRYSRPAGAPRPLIAHRSPILDPLHRLPPDYPTVPDEYLARLPEVYADAAGLAERAGFDGVDLKACHGYLISELLASFTRQGRYGGSFDNRIRLLLEAVEAVRAALRRAFVTTRVNAFDGIPYPYGFGVDREDPTRVDLKEPLELVRRLSLLGVPLLNVSLGNPYYNPQYGRPFDFPVQGAPVPREHPLVAVDRFLGITRAFQKAFPQIPVVGGGYSWLRQWIPYVAAGALAQGDATLIGLGREAFAYPDAVRDILEKGRMDPTRCCIACSACTQIMRDGGRTGCVVRDAEIYGPEYRQGRRFSLDRLQEEARRCRECEEPTCAQACPAHVSIPAFLRAFADGDFQRAYDCLREHNRLPEMCATVCPPEVQCEGRCLEKIFSDRPIPIRDIQLVACQIARREGYVAVRMPPAPSGYCAAVVGGGPAGLAATIRLLELGHAVELVDRSDRLGGTPDQMIPEERYQTAQAEIDAILAPALESGRLRLRLRTKLSPQATGWERHDNGLDRVTLEALRRQFPAILLALGLDQTEKLGRGPGVVDALTFLRRVKKAQWKERPRRVAVIGGGNTAMDAAVCALRMGAEAVFVLYRRSFRELPAWPAEQERLLKLGGHLMILTQPLDYVTDSEGRLVAVRIVRTDLGPPDASGRRQPIVVPGTEQLLPVDMVIEAMGQKPSEEVRAALADLEWTDEGLLKTRAGSSATSLVGVFAAGDIVSGAGTVAGCVASGTHAAEEMDSYLRDRGRTGGAMAPQGKPQRGDAPSSIPFGLEV